MAGTGAIVDLSSSQHPNAAALLRKRAVFLDRDGTLIRHCEYLTELSDLELFEETGEAVRLLNQRRIPAVVITNQSAVARGLLSEDGLLAIHSEMQARLRHRGAFLDAFYYCPHHPTEGEQPYRRNCTCRKPQPGLIVKASDELGLSPRLSFMVGDSQSDLEAGRRAGCRTVLIETEGDENHSLAEIGSSADFVATDVLQAVHWILGEIV